MVGLCDTNLDFVPGVVETLVDLGRRAVGVGVGRHLGELEISDPVLETRGLSSTEHHDDYIGINKVWSFWEKGQVLLENAKTNEVSIFFFFFFLGEGRRASWMSGSFTLKKGEEREERQTWRKEGRSAVFWLQQRLMRPQRVRDSKSVGVGRPGRLPKWPTCV
jgi:hypothetical protein